MYIHTSNYTPSLDGLKESARSRNGISAVDPDAPPLNVFEQFPESDIFDINVNKGRINLSLPWVMILNLSTIKLVARDIPPLAASSAADVFIVISID